VSPGGPTLRQERRIAVLTNVYPSPSHTFIRREIQALESMGWQIERFSHRRCDPRSRSREDRVEAERTSVLMETPKARVLAVVLMLAFTRPIALAGTLAQAVRLARQSDGRIARHLAYALLACILWGQLRGRGCKHLHVHFGTNPAAVASLLHRLCGMPFSMTFHGPHEFEVPNRLGLPMKIADAAFIAVVSNWAKGEFIQRYPAHAMKAVLVRCGLDSSWFSGPVMPVAQNNNLVCVARLDAQKNPLLLIEAAEMLAAKGIEFQLTFIGDGVLRAQLEARVHKGGLDRCIRFHGWGSSDEVRQALRHSRALVLSSDDEGLPVAIMEAFAMGRPAIATDVAAVHELVDSGVTGWLVRPRDALALAESMQAALHASPATLDEMGALARKRIAAYDVRATSLAISAALSDAVDSRYAPTD
jgi:colanic acid/amylovoran biosynthesis glycosyltransferase